MTASGNLITLCEISEVPEGGAIKVEPPGHVLAVFNLGGKIFVIDDECTHGPGSLSEGLIEDDVVECNFHNGAFNIITGEVVAPPCMIPIRTYKVVMQDGKVCIDPDQPADTAASA
ncbi:MAG TPA: non-heme iron oxygenase ferredoxin subunit [Casimicrobiaceae bacterium]|nr:non-heme iron oxygenase ferredoxin subunit [Casimicrobiaceae bacterium]